MQEFLAGLGIGMGLAIFIMLGIHCAAARAFLGEEP